MNPNLNDYELGVLVTTLESALSVATVEGRDGIYVDAQRELLDKFTAQRAAKSSISGRDNNGE